MMSITVMQVPGSGVEVSNPSPFKAFVVDKYRELCILSVALSSI